MAWLGFDVFQLSLGDGEDFLQHSNRFNLDLNYRNAASQNTPLTIFRQIQNAFKNPEVYTYVTSP